jgi:uncharacterized membrane protein YfcA
VTDGILLIAAAGFVAYVVRGITGGASAIVFNATFGLALAFGLAGGMELLDGLYWVALADLVATLVLLVTLRAELVLEPFLVRYLLASVPVSVAATLALPHLDLTLLGAGLGLSLVAAGLYLLLRRDLGHWDEPTLVRRAFPAGLVTGVLGGLYGMGGPVSIVFLSHAGPDPRRFRTRVTILSSVWGSTRVATLLLSGAMAGTDLARFAITLPVVLAGLAVGFRLHDRVSPTQFRSILGAVVCLAGAALVVRTLVG